MRAEEGRRRHAYVHVVMIQCTATSSISRMPNELASYIEQYVFLCRSKILLPTLVLNAPELPINLTRFCCILDDLCIY